MSRIEIIKCDIKDCDSENCEVHKETIQVIFTTEQTEGRATKPYLSLVNIDLCEGCKEYLLKGHYILAQGAMGYNKYEFKD